MSTGVEALSRFYLVHISAPFSQHACFLLPGDGVLPLASYALALLGRFADLRSPLQQLFLAIVKLPRRQVEFVERLLDRHDLAL